MQVVFATTTLKLAAFIFESIYQDCWKIGVSRMRMLFNR